jgi:hypothetical protein
MMMRFHLFAEAAVASLPGVAYILVGVMVLV